MEKFTAIYNNSWMSGSHRHTVTCMKRLEQRPNESIMDMLRRENIEEATVFLFCGHPPQQGEEQDQT